MTTAQPQLRRIALRAAGVQHDLVLPQGDALAHALAAAGVRLGPADRVLDPGGMTIDVATPAAKLREGGLYSVTSPAVLAGRRARAVSATAVPSLAWALAALGATSTALALLLPESPLRWAAAALLAVSAVLVATAWGARTDERTSVAGFGLPLLLAAAAGALGVPGPITAAIPGRIAMACTGAAILGALLMVSAREPRIRAAAGPVVAISGVLAGLALLSPMLRWDAAQLAIVVGGAAVVGVRAAPSLLVGVDEGYHIDYGRFMVLRWTVRGRVPEFREHVEERAVRGTVSRAEARLEVTLQLFSLLAALGIALLALPVTGDDLIAAIAAMVAIVCMPVGLLLTSRRTSAQALRRPPRIAAVIGLTGFAVVFAVRGDAFATLIVGGVLLVAALVAAGMVLPVARGHRSLAWSRTGDLVDSIAVAFALPASLLAAGTLVLLRGVLVG